MDTKPTIEIPEVKLNGPPAITKADAILDCSEVTAEFNGGMHAWYRYLRDNLTFPEQTKKKELDGTALIQFVINTDGSVQDVEKVRDVHSLLDKKAVRMIQNTPNWLQGKHPGKKAQT